MARLCPDCLLPEATECICDDESAITPSGTGHLLAAILDPQTEPGPPYTHVLKLQETEEEMAAPPVAPSFTVERDPGCTPLQRLYVAAARSPHADSSRSPMNLPQGSAAIEQARAPFSPDQVASLNAFQVSGAFHPFTCGNDFCPGTDGRHAVLVAAEDGWHCPVCTYTQDWAHVVMADNSWEQWSGMTVKVDGGPPVIGEIASAEWTPEQIDAFKAEFERALTSGDRHRFRPVWLPVLPSPITHIAGAQVQVGSKLRQRCSWCGAILCDYDLNRIAVPEGQDPRPAMWEPGSLIHVDGVLSMTVDHEDGQDLPDDACARADVEA